MEKKLIIAFLLVLILIFLEGCSNSRPNTVKSRDAADAFYSVREPLRYSEPEVQQDKATPLPSIPEVNRAKPCFNPVLPTDTVNKKKKQQKPEDRDLGQGADKEQIGKPKP